MIEDMLTMRPPLPSAIIPRTTNLVSMIGESTLRRISASTCGFCMVASSPSVPMAALFTSP